MKSIKNPGLRECGIVLSGCITARGVVRTGKQFTPQDVGGLRSPKVLIATREP